MSDADAIRRERMSAKETGKAGEASAFKDRFDNKESRLSLTELVAGRDKLAAKGVREAASKEHGQAGSDRTQAKGGLSNFVALFGMGLLRQLEGPESAEKAREYTWLAARSNFRELPKLYGRKFLQPGKVETKKKELVEEEKSVHKRQLEATKRIEDSTPLVDDEQEDREREEDEEDNETIRLRDAEQEEEIAQDLQFEKIYDEKDYLEELKRATELALGIDEAHNKGKQVFKHLEKIHPHDMSQASTTPLSRLSRKRLRECIRKLSGGKVIVVGDLLIDELLEGKPERISREAPVLILEHMVTELIPGGAANTAHNITALGGTCHAVGVCGKDEYATKLASLLDKYGISHSLVQDPSRPTTVKTRILSKAHAIRQQLLRLDRISHATIDSVVQTLLAERLERAAGSHQAVILSDYRAGVISNGIITATSKVAARHNLSYVVDAQEEFERFQGVTLLTPNQPDAEKAVGYAFDSPEKLIKGGEDLLVLTGAQAVLITRGPDGMVLFLSGQPPQFMPVFNRSDVFDVTGAGDTVVATMTLALVTGSSLQEAMALGNLAAGIVVRKPGTAVTSQEELINNLELIPLAEE